MKKFFSIMMFAAFLAGMASCSKGNIEPTAKVIKGEIKESETTLYGNYSWLGPEKDDHAVFSSFSSLASDSENAAIIILDGTALEANKDILNKHYNNNRIIILCDPDFSVYNRIAGEFGWPVVSNDNEESELFAFSLAGTCDLLTPEQPIIIDNPEILPGSDEDLTIPTATPNEEGIIEKYETPSFEEITTLENIIGPFINAVNSLFVVLDGTKANGSPDLAKYVSDFKAITIPVKLCFAETALSDKDYVTGNYQVGFRYKYEPLYAYQGQNSSGDYYIMNVTYESYTGSVFTGEDAERSHGAVSLYYTGAYLRSFGVRTYIKAITGTNDGKPVFIQGHEPIPGTDIDAKDFSETRSWSIGGGVTGGWNWSKGGGGNLSGDFNWGISRSSTVSYKVMDLSVSNTRLIDTNGDNAQWTFTCNNLPQKNGKRHITKPCPKIARTTAAFQTNWIWHMNKYSDGDTTSVGNMIAEFHPILGISRNGFWYKYVNYQYDLGVKSVAVKMVVPNRIPFGTIRVKNTFTDGTVISDIVVKEYPSGTEPVYTSYGDFSASDQCEISLRPGKYSISFKGTKGPEISTYTLKDNYFEIKKRQNDLDVATLDAISRFKK